jgi:hypothetical protein
VRRQETGNLRPLHVACVFFPRVSRSAEGERPASALHYSIGYFGDCGFNTWFLRLSIDIFILTHQEMVLNYISKTHSTTAVIVLSAAVPLLYIVVRKVLHRLSAPIRQLPGPKSVNWLTGSLERHVWEPDAQDSQLEWTQKYGHVFRYYGMFNVSVPYVTDSNKIGPFYISRRPSSLLRISKR